MGSGRSRRKQDSEDPFFFVILSRQRVVDKRTRIVKNTSFPRVIFVENNSNIIDDSFNVLFFSFQSFDPSNSSNFFFRRIRNQLNRQLVPSKSFWKQFALLRNSSAVSGPPIFLPNVKFSGGNERSPQKPSLFYSVSTTVFFMNLQSQCVCDSPPSFPPSHTLRRPFRIFVHRAHVRPNFHPPFPFSSRIPFQEGHLNLGFISLYFQRTRWSFIGIKRFAYQC